MPKDARVPGTWDDLWIKLCVDSKHPSLYTFCGFTRLGAWRGLRADFKAFRDTRGTDGDFRCVCSNGCCCKRRLVGGEPVRLGDDREGAGVDCTDEGAPRSGLGTPRR